MGIFGGNFTKPGKGISKEEAAKRNYFDILGRRFWDLVKLNLLYFGCNILFFGAAVILIIPYFYEMEAVIETLFKNPHVILPPLPFIPFIFIGPFTTGFTYVLRNWSRQEHAFLVSDFFEVSKKNWKQGLALSAISTIVTYLFCTAFFFYFKSGIGIELVLVIAGLVAVLLLSMSFYTYPMVVTFDMKLKVIIKNAWLFALIKLPQNLFFVVIIMGVHFLLLWNFPLIWAILMPLILIAWSGFTMNYYAWHVLNKHMMPEQEATQEERKFTDSLQEGNRD